ncbi:MAG: arylesterase [Maribacter sp.]|nr:arylesterase [Maribacter sp.]
MGNILKFSYFLGLLLIFACGEKKAMEPTMAQPDANDVKTDVATTTGSKVILFFGNSLTAGYGLDIQEAFPALVQQRIDSLRLPFTVINSGVSGETTTGGKNRLNWVLDQKIDVVVLELGANDGLRGIPLQETRKNLQEIIDAVRSKNPETKIVLAGMQIPPNMGNAYTSEFRNIYPDLAKKNDTYLIPFLLKDVAGIPELNQDDGIHPTAEGEKIVADNVWDVLKEVVQKQG